MTVEANTERRLPGVDLSIGMLLPSGNIVAERQVRAMLAPGVSLHTTRLPLTGSSEPELLAMIGRLEESAGLLADARVDLIAFNCTAVSTFKPDAESEIVRRIESVSRGAPALTTADALLAALRTLDARRIALITPYIEAVTRREVGYFQHHGLTVACAASYDIDSNWDMARAPAQTWYDLVLAHRRDDVDAYLLSCTAIESAEIIEPLEAELGRPVLTSNQALAWHCQRSAGVGMGVAGFGRLLRQAD
jgi:maleate cis-trans isomerase